MRETVQEYSRDADCVRARARRSRACVLSRPPALISPAVAYGWAPDSRYFVTATLAPRMNVDNGVHIYKYNGEGPMASLP